MPTALHLTTAFIVGALLGGLFFGGLWWTVRRLPRTRHALALYVASLVLRLALILPGFYLVLLYYDWPELLACLAGFLAARVLLTHWMGKTSLAGLPSQEAIHDG